MSKYYQPKRRKIVKAKKRKFSAMQVGSVARPIKMVAPKLVVELPYCFTFTSTSTTVYKRAEFRLNSVFAPVVGTGHQPRGFDQYAALYDKYVVHKAHVKIVASNADLSGSSTIAAIIMSPGTTSPGIDDIQKADESKGSKFRLLQPGYNQPVVMKSTYDIAEYLGFEEAREETRVTDNPTTPLYLTVLTDSAMPSNGHTVTFHIVIRYTTVFMDMKEIGAS